MNPSILITLLAQLIIESLPLSSSTHVLLGHTLLGINPHHLSDSCETALHLINVLIYAWYFRQQWRWLAIASWRSTFGARHTLTASSRKRLAPIITHLLILVSTSAMITILFHHLIKGRFTTLIATHAPLLMPLGLLVTTMLLSAPRFMSRGPRACQPLVHGIALGLAQSCALLPGVSRLAATYCTGRALGTTPRRSFQASFLIAAPLFAAASIKEMITTGSHLITLLDLHMMFTAVLASLLSYAALHLSYTLAIRHRLWLFAPYTGLIALIILFS